MGIYTCLNIIIMLYIHYRLVDSFYLYNLSPFMFLTS